MTAKEIRATIARCLLVTSLFGLMACSKSADDVDINPGGFGGAPSGGIGGASAAGSGATGGAAGMVAGGIGGAAGSAGTGGVAGSAGTGSAGVAGIGMAGTGEVDAGGGAMPGDAGDDVPSDDPINVEVMGPHAFDTFTEGASAPEYAEGLVYYPTDSDGPFPAMVLSPGLTASNTDYEVWGRVLASHGFVGLLMQPTSTSDWNTARATDLKAGLGVVKQLNTAGTLAGKIDVANIGFMGHSMGGGGTLIAADEVGDMIQAAIPTQPYAPGGSFPGVTCPILIIAAENDAVATTASNAFTHYNSIPESTKKIFLEGAGRDHYFSTDRLEDDFEINARYAVAFLKLYLAQDTRYETYLFGDEHEAYMASNTISRYLSPLLP
jgi:dienelactone hydrolase